MTAKWIIGLTGAGLAYWAWRELSQTALERPPAGRGDDRLPVPATVPAPTTPQPTPRSRSRPTVTINAIGVLFATLDDAFIGRLHRADAATALTRILKSADVFVLVPGITNDASEALIEAAFVAVFDPLGWDRRMLVCCEQLSSLVSIVRHIAPLLHVDGQEAIAAALSPHVPNVACVRAVRGGNSGDRISILSSIAEVPALLSRISSNLKP